MGKIANKAQRSELKWHGHVLRREEHYMGRRAMEMKAHGRRKRGRPKEDGLTK